MESYLGAVEKKMNKIGVEIYLAMKIIAFSKMK